MKNSSLLKTLALGLTFLVGIVNAQSITGKSMKVTVDGTSSLHDWTMNSTSATFSAQISGNALSNVVFKMPAKNLKSTKGKMMDNKAHEALKADQASTISFTATSINIGKGTAQGKMSIAGVTKNVTFPVTVTKSGSNYSIVGTYTGKMSEYGMKTPGFMGVKTGDQVKVSVNISAN